MPKNNSKHPRRHPLRKVTKSPIEFEAPKKKAKPVRQHRGNRKAPLPELTPKEIKDLKGKAHHLSPLVTVGDKGLTEMVINAIHDAFDAHELIKVKMHAPEDKAAMAKELAERSESILIGLIGHVVILFKPFPAPQKEE